MAFSITEVDTIFAAAVELSSPDERAEYLRRVCGDNDELRQRVDELLAAHFEAGDFLGRPHATVFYGNEDVQAGPGKVIGPYKLLQQIGEGGMGVVFMAEQTEPIQRTVALKIIKPGMDTRQVIGRFEAERQALAMMDHPSIAKVLDAGTTDTGRPYFVMELVKGVPITKYCDDHQLSIRERLELFTPVCEAVHHAHQKGIIHRDLKPTNVLVAEYDNQPIPKIIDFGVAKATAQKLTTRTMFTEFGQVIGTVEYMSPEQAKFNQLDIDTRSDIYALGVLLYELLTDSTPFERERLREAAFDEVLRIIREEEPPKPSTRLSTSDTLPSIAASRHTEPARLSKAVRGELDWIVMKALEKDRNRRYETAKELSSDLDRYLTDKPIEACPPSRAYRLRKYARRNKGLLVTTTIVATVLVVASLASTWQAIRASHAEARARNSEARALASERAAILERDAKEQARREAVSSAERAHAAAEAEAAQRRRAEEVSNFLVNAFASPDPQRDGRSVTIAEVLDRAVKQLQGQLADDPATKGKLLGSIGQSYLGLGLYREAITPLEEACQLLATSGAPADDQIESMVLLATAYRSVGRVDESVHLSEETVTLAKTELGPEHRNTLIAMGSLADAYHYAGRLNDALELQKETLVRTRAALGPRHVDTITSLSNVASASLDVGRLDEAIQLNKEALDLSKTVLGPEDLHTIGMMNNLGIAYREANRVGEAIPLLEEAVRLAKNKLGAEHPNSLALLNGLSAAYSDAGRRAEALPLLEETATLQKAKLGPAHPSTLISINNLAVHYGDAGQLGKAVLLLEQNLKDLRAGLGSTHPVTLNSMLNLVAAYRAAGRMDEALSLSEEALKLSRTKHGAEQVYTLKAANNMASAYAAAGRLKEAIAALDTVVELNPIDSLPNRQIDLTWLFATAAALKDSDPPLAIELATRATKLAPHDGSNWNTLGIARYRTGDWKSAVKDFEKSMQLRQGGEAEDLFFLAMAHWQLGHQDEARTWFDKAVEAMEDKRLTDRNLLTFRAEAAKLLAPTYDEAVAAARLTIEREPNNAIHHNDLGVALKAQGKYDEAVSAYRKSIDLNPHDAAYVDLCKALILQGNATEAAATLRNLLQRQPSTTEALDSFATKRVFNQDTGHDYQRINIPMTWHDAQEFCALLGGHLATATSHQENDFLYEHFGKDHVCWLGATDERKEAQWSWVTGEPWQNTNWFNGEPNNVNGVEQYLAFGSTPPVIVDGQTFFFDFRSNWVDVDGSGKYHGVSIAHPICEWDEHDPKEHDPGQGVGVTEPQPSTDSSDQPQSHNSP